MLMTKIYLKSLVALVCMLLVTSTAKADLGVIYLLGASNDWTMADTNVNLTETEEGSNIYYNESVEFADGDYLAVYTQIDTSWGLDYRYAGYSGGETITPNTASTLYSNSTLGWETSFYLATGGTYAVTVDMNESTILLYSEDYSIDLPTSVYLLGNDGVWDPSVSAGELTETEEGSGIFTGTLTATANYFAIVTALGEDSDDWTTPNSNRYGPSSDGTAITVGESTEMIYGSTASWYIEEGTYSITADFNELTLLISTSTGINSVSTDTATGQKYNLAGQKVSSAKGIVIQDGKKYIAK